MTHIIALITNVLTAEAVLTTSAQFAAHGVDAEVELIYPRPDTDPEFLPTEEIYGGADRAAFEAKQDQIFKILAGLAEAKGQSIRPLRGAATSLGAQATEMADIVILGAPHGDFEAKSLLETILFKVKKPVLIVPRRMKPEFGQSIAIGWEAGNDAASRAMDSVNQLQLTSPRTVTLLIGDDKQGAAPPEALSERLTSAGVALHVRHFSTEGRHIGEALLAEAHEAGADLLVMGAFSHGRLWEFLFGGATVEILKDLDLPILMHH